MTESDLKSRIRSVPDFPREGIVFRDITTLLQDPEAFRTSVDRLADAVSGLPVDCVVGIEARGFIFGGALADRLGAGFVPVRKKGKLPAATLEAAYALEYGTDTLAVHRDAVAAGQNVLMFDDLLATGGTMAASCRMIEQLGGVVVACLFLIDLSFLNGRERLAGYDVRALLAYDEE